MFLLGINEGFTILLNWNSYASSSMLPHANKKMCIVKNKQKKTIHLLQMCYKDDFSSNNPYIYIVCLFIYCIHVLQTSADCIQTGIDVSLLPA